MVKLRSNSGGFVGPASNSHACITYPELQPYDRIAVTAACTQIPAPLLEQLAIGGGLIAPVIGAKALLNELS